MATVTPTQSKASVQTQSPAEQNLRAEQVQESRRRRSADFEGYALRLGVDPVIKDPNFEYRWINDDKGRLEQLTKYDDWDFVNDPRLANDERNKGADTRMRREAGRSSTGGVMYAYYCKKRKDYYEADEQKKVERRLALREQRIRNQDIGLQGGIADDPHHTYIPAGVQAQINAHSGPTIRRAGR